MTILAPHIPEEMDPDWVGLLDARMSGWFLKDTDELFRGFRISASDSVLDVGCGDGVSTLFCAERGAQVTFADIDGDCVRAVEEKVRAQGKAREFEGVVGDSDPLQVADGIATRVICQEVLEHVADPNRVVGELARAGKPALYLLTVPGEQGEQVQKSFAPADYFEHPNHIRVFSREDFAGLVQGSGLEVVEHTSNGFYWTFWVCIQWAIQGAQARSDGGEYSVSHNPFKPPYDDILISWANLWAKMISTPEGEAFKKEMDRVLPKVQIILARKPG